MTESAQFYASAPAGIAHISTLEITHSSFRAIRTCSGFVDQAATLETGEVVTFKASALDVSLPARDATGQQNLQFAIENVTGQAQNAILAVIDSDDPEPVTVIYRMYLSSDLSEPAEPPLRMVLVAPEFKGATMQVVCSYLDIINMAWPRDRYTTDFAPGLKYL